MINAGNFAISKTVLIPFNTYDGNGGSTTVTNLVAADVRIHKDGGATERTSSSGISVFIDFDGITGNHLIAIDLSDNADAGFYSQGSDYTVRIEGITVDTQVINSWVGMFSIENRFDVVSSVTNDVGITQTGADKAWVTTTRILTAGFSLIFKKNTDSPTPITFHLFDSTGALKPGIDPNDITANISIDGANYTPMVDEGNIDTVGLGTYKIIPKAADLNGNFASIQFTATSPAGMQTTIVDIQMRE